MIEKTPKSCRHCRKPTLNKFGLTIACDYSCATQYGITKARKKQAIAERRKLLEERQEDRAAKEANKTLKKLCAEARVVVQRNARLRDQKWGVCVCCGVPKIEDGAHLFAVGSKYQNSRISLNPLLIHGSCAKCNRFVGGGNMEGYIAGLVARYGQSHVDELRELKRKADHGEDAPLSKDEVREIKTKYNKLNRELEKQQAGE